MSWLDANEYFIMEAAARARVDDLHASVDRALASADAEDTPGDAPEPGRARSRCDPADTGPLRKRPSLGRTLMAPCSQPGALAPGR